MLSCQSTLPSPLSRDAHSEIPIVLRIRAAAPQEVEVDSPSTMKSCVERTCAKSQSGFSCTSFAARAQITNVV